MTFDIEFHKTHFAIDKINKVYIGKGGGGRNRQTIPRNKTKTYNFNDYIF